MLPLPSYIPTVFSAVVAVTLWLFYRTLNLAAIGHALAIRITAILLVWMVIQSAAALSGFYQNSLSAMPPRITLALVPTLLVIMALFVSNDGRSFIDRLPLLPLTYLHTVRIPVEIVLYWLYLQQAVPELMTFAGRNFDILAGITAPVIAYFGFRRPHNRNLLIVWNLLALGLLLFIIANAILSAPLPLQQFGFDQPNVALFYFPFVLLPAVVVPIVLFSHLVALRQLIVSKVTFQTTQSRTM